LYPKKKTSGFLSTIFSETIKVLLFSIYKKELKDTLEIFNSFEASNENYLDRHDHADYNLN